MRVRGYSWVAILSLSVPGTTWAFTQAEIDQAALVARQIDIVSVIADDIALYYLDKHPQASQFLLYAEEDPDRKDHEALILTSEAGVQRLKELMKSVGE